jgi:hypothetical protein
MPFCHVVRRTPHVFCGLLLAVALTSPALAGTVYLPPPPPSRPVYVPPQQPAPQQQQQQPANNNNEPVCRNQSGQVIPCPVQQQRQPAAAGCRNQAGQVVPCLQQQPAAAGCRNQAGQVVPCALAPGQRTLQQQPGVRTAHLKPGVIKGPAGALRKTIPAKVVHNPRHRMGRAGARYNKQAFMFHRRSHLFRRFYYIGPDAGVYFYDEAVADDDPSLAGVDPNALATCPEDSDNCEGFDQSYATVSAQDDAAARAQAFQLLLTQVGGIVWGDAGLNVTTGPDQGSVFVPYPQWHIKLENVKLAIGLGLGGISLGTEALRIYTADGAFLNIAVGSYAQNKDFWDQIIRALKAIGMQVTPPGPDEIDITSI